MVRRVGDRLAPAAARRALLSLAAATLLLGHARGADPGPGSLLRIFPVPGAFATGDVVAAGDLDEDGFGDLAVADPLWYEGGRVHLLSGKDGSLLRTLEGIGDGMGQGDGFGYSLAVLGDIDGRGKPDLLVGAPRGQGGVPEASRPTYAKAFAGEDGAPLFDSGPRSPDAQFGRVVAGLGDLDGDGARDFAVASMDRIGEGAFDGAVHVYSGASGDPLGTFQSGTPNEYFGTSIAALGDVDGDGRSDFAVGAPGHSRGRKVQAGRVSIVSGASLREIRSIPGRRFRGRFGTSLAALGPSGADSLRLLVGSTRLLEVAAGSVELMDAATGRRLRRYRGAGSAVIALGDQDGDGVADFARSGWTVGDDGELDGGSLIDVVSGATGRVLRGLRGWPREYLEPFAAGDVDGDGLADLAVTAPAEDVAREVRAYRVDGAAAPRSVRVALQRPEGQLDVEGDFSGTAEVSPGGQRQPIGIDLPAGPINGDVHVEVAPGAGTFMKVGEMRAVYGDPHPKTGIQPYQGQALDLYWNVALPPAELRRSILADFAGRLLRVTPHDLPDVTILQAVIPAPGVADFRGRSLLAPPVPVEGPAPSARVRVASRGEEGTLRLEVAARRLPEGPDYDLWIEDSVGAGTFSEAGPLIRGRLVIDTARGDPMPGIVSDGAALSGRTVEVRAAGETVLRGTMPTAGTSSGP